LITKSIENLSVLANNISNEKKNYPLHEQLQKNTVYNGDSYLNWKKQLICHRKLSPWLLYKQLYLVEYNLLLLLLLCINMIFIMILWKILPLSLQIRDVNLLICWNVSFIVEYVITHLYYRGQMSVWVYIE